MGISSSVRLKQEQEKKEQEQHENLLKTKEILEQKIKDSELLADAKFKQLKSLKEEAKQKLNEGDKVGAKRCLLKKKRMEKLVENLNAQLTMMDDQVSNLENAIYLGQITSALKKANQVIKDNAVTVEQIEEEAAKIDEFKNQQIEFGQVLEDYNNEDEADIEDELAKCEDELRKEVDLPSAHKENIKTKEKNKNKNEFDLELDI